MAKFKKVLASLLVSSMVMTMTFGCGKKEESVTQDNTTESVVSEDTTTETTTEAPSEETTQEETADIANGDIIIDLTFDSDVQNCLTYTNGGSLNLRTVNGELCATIDKIGTLDYANQTYYDGFNLHQGCVYEFSFDVHCDIERKMQWRIQLNGGDYHAYVGEDIDINSETKHISTQFTMEEPSDPAPRLCFNMGIFDGMEANTGEHSIYIDNVLLKAVDVSKAQNIEALPEPIAIKVNQLGYKASDYKKATVSSKEAQSFEVIDVSSGKSVYQGTLPEDKFDGASGKSYKTADFSELVSEGTYKIVTDNGLESYEFDINENVYDDLYKDVVLMLYKQRCGIATDKAIAGDFNHGVCHNEPAVIWGTETAIDVSGGWHDAGDYGRYVVSGAKTVADLFLAIEDSELAKADDLGIPESGNKIPDLLDEARYELEWMLKMQDASSGGVYHKVTCEVFPDTVMPEEETAPLIVSPISNTATGDFAAVMAKAAVLYAEYDKEFATTCLAAARSAWSYLEQHKEDNGFKNPENIETGEYPDETYGDEYFWAAVELYIATNEDIYKECIETAFKDEENFGKGLGWDNVGYYGIYDYCMYVGDNKEIEAILIKKADTLKSMVLEDGYNSSMGKSYGWGSNMSIANNGMILVMAYHVTEDISYIEPAKYQLDYLLGRNAVGYCYVTGYGDFSPLDTHHRPSQVIGKSMPGMLVGGANANFEDPYAKAILTGLSPELCYVDNVQSYSCNEVTIYWNSPLIYLLATLK